PAGRREQRIPHRLAVVMGMHVDPARRDEQAIGIDLAPRRSLLAAHGSNAIVLDRDIAAERRLAGPIDDGAAANDDVVHGRRSSASRPDDEALLSKARQRLRTLFTRHARPVPGTHVLFSKHQLRKTWMAGTSPAMTAR